MGSDPDPTYGRLPSTSRFNVLYDAIYTSDNTSGVDCASLSLIHCLRQLRATDPNIFLDPDLSLILDDPDPNAFRAYYRKIALAAIGPNPLRHTRISRAASSTSASLRSFAASLIPRAKCILANYHYDSGRSGRLYDGSDQSLFDKHIALSNHINGSGCYEQIDLLILSMHLRIRIKILAPNFPSEEVILPDVDSVESEEYHFNAEDWFDNSANLYGVSEELAASVNLTLDDMRDMILPSPDAPEIYIGQTIGAANQLLIAFKKRRIRRSKNAEGQYVYDISWQRKNTNHWIALTPAQPARSSTTAASTSIHALPATQATTSTGSTVICYASDTPIEVSDDEIPPTPRSHRPLRSLLCFSPDLTQFEDEVRASAISPIESPISNRHYENQGSTSSPRLASTAAQTEVTSIPESPIPSTNLNENLVQQISDSQNFENSNGERFPLEESRRSATDRLCFHCPVVECPDCDSPHGFATKGMLRDHILVHHYLSSSHLQEARHLLSSTAIEKAGFHICTECKYILCQGSGRSHNCIPLRQRINAIPEVRAAQRQRSPGATITDRLVFPESGGNDHADTNGYIGDNTHNLSRSSRIRLQDHNTRQVQTNIDWEWFSSDLPDIEPDTNANQPSRIIISATEEWRLTPNALSFIDTISAKQLAHLGTKSHRLIRIDKLSSRKVLKRAFVSQLCAIVKMFNNAVGDAQRATALKLLSLFHHWLLRPIPSSSSSVRTNSNLDRELRVRLFHFKNANFVALHEAWVGSLQVSQSSTNSEVDESRSPAVSSIASRAEALAERGLLTKAMQLLMGQEPLIQPDYHFMETQVLQLYESDGRDQAPDNNNNNDNSVNDSNNITFDWEQLASQFPKAEFRKAVRNLNRTNSSGPDGISYLSFKLLEAENGAAFNEFHKMLVRLLHCGPPPQLDYLWRATRLMLLKKKNGKPRPIGITGALQRLCDAFLMQLPQSRAAIAQLPKSFSQLGIKFKRAGPLQHLATEVKLQSIPGAIVVDLDIQNAFNSVYWDSIHKSLELFPDLIPIFKPSVSRLYRPGIKILTKLTDGAIHEIEMRRGVHQGLQTSSFLFDLVFGSCFQKAEKDTMGTLQTLWSQWEIALAEGNEHTFLRNHPIATELKQFDLSPQFGIRFRDVLFFTSYQDDCRLVSTPLIAQAFIDRLAPLLQGCGLLFNPQKCSFYDRYSMQRAQPAQLSIYDQSVARSLGLVAGGFPIGTSAFLQQFLEEKQSRMSHCFDLIVNNLRHPSIMLSLGRHCINTQCQYLFDGWTADEANILKGFAETCDTLTCSFIETVIRTPGMEDFGSIQKAQVFLKQGGLAFQSAVQHQPIRLVRNLLSLVRQSVVLEEYEIRKPISPNVVATASRLLSYREISNLILIATNGFAGTIFRASTDPTAQSLTDFANIFNQAILSLCPRLNPNGSQIATTPPFHTLGAIKSCLSRMNFERSMKHLNDCKLWMFYKEKARLVNLYAHTTDPQLATAYFLSEVESRDTWVRCISSFRKDLRMSPERMRISCQLRLGINPCPEAAAKTCFCKQRTKASQYHLLSCKRSTVPLKRHNKLRDLFVAELSAARITVSSVESSEGFTRSSLRPDFTTEHTHSGAKTMFDVTVVSPATTSAVQSNGHKKPGVALRNAERAKSKKYASLIAADPTSLSFRPLCFETTGFFNKSTAFLLNDIASKQDIQASLIDGPISETKSHTRNPRNWSARSRIALLKQRIAILIRSSTADVFIQAKRAFRNAAEESNAAHFRSVY